jgi:uncharacterized protein YdhG (YjbR/CyaY superfamily)
MKTSNASPTTIDAYIAACAPEARPVLEQIRAAVRAAAPEAVETIKYRMPTFTLNGNLVYFAAFKTHIGFYPPVGGPATLKKALARYAGPKNSLKFPLAEPMPYELIRRIVAQRVKENAAKARAKTKK